MPKNLVNTIRTMNIFEAATWIPGDGRPRGGSHIENIRFWDLPDASLKYIQKDASDAMKANPEGKKAGKYADEVNDAATVLFWRKKNKIVVESGEIEDHVNEIFDSNIEMDEAKNDASKYTDDKLKAVLKQLKGLDQDAPSTKSMLKKVEKEIEKRGLSEQFDSVITEAAAMSARKLVKVMSDTSEWGDDAKEKVYVKGKNFVYLDTFYFGGDKALLDLVKGWTQGGAYHEYILKTYRIDLKIVDTFIELVAEGSKHKKLSKNGIVGVELSIGAGAIKEDYYNVIYKTKLGKVEGEKTFEDKTKATAYAEKGNSLDKVGGTYTVTKIRGAMENIEELKRFGLTKSLLDAVTSVVKAEQDGDEKDEKAAKKIDTVNKAAIKKKFDDRKDKDIDNDGDVDDSDEYLHNRRKKVSKAIAKEDNEEEPSKKVKKKSDDGDDSSDDGDDVNVNVTVDNDDDDNDDNDNDEPKKSDDNDEPKKSAPDPDEKSDEEKKKEKEYVAKKSKKKEKVDTNPSVSEEIEIEKSVCLAQLQEKYMKDLMKREPEFIAKYGSRHEDVIHATALKLANNKFKTL